VRKIASRNCWKCQRKISGQGKTGLCKRCVKRVDVKELMKKVEKCGKCGKVISGYGKSEFCRVCSHIGQDSTSQRKKMKELWKNREFQRRMKIAFNVRPNASEILLNDVLQRILPGEYEYVGDFKIFFGGKNPDFLCRSKETIIEFFGDFWHSKYVTNRSKEENERQRIEHMKKYGFRTLVVWTGELKDTVVLENKILRFHNG